MPGKLFTMRMSADDAERFERVASHFEQTIAGVIRMLMRREDDAIQGLAQRRPRPPLARRAAQKKGAR